jgi:DNA-binding transcriptional MerR regulator
MVYNIVGGEFVKINDVERITGLTQKAIRLYESKGLVNIARDENGYRNYSDEDIEGLNKIKLFRSVGVSIADIKLYIFGVTKLEEMLDISLDMSKEDLVSSCEIKSAHAIAMAGVKLGEDGRPERWLVENSFGTVRGWSGFVVMQNEWLEKYMFRLVVEKQFVPPHLLKYLEMKPKVLKSWNPSY